MRILARLAALAAAGAVSACGGLGPTPSAETAFPYASAYAGQNLNFDPAARSDALRAPGYKGWRKGGRFCPGPHHMREDLAELERASLQAVSLGRGYSNAPRAWSRYLNTRAALLLLDHDLERAAEDVDSIRAHAESGSWIPEKIDTGSTWVVAEALGTLLPAWSILRTTDIPTEEDRRVIEDWLADLVAVARQTPYEHNARLYVKNVEMMAAMMGADDARVEESARDGYVAYLRAMRPDGSFPTDVERGRQALINQAAAVASMVFAAELAASRGMDLYGLEIDGKTVHDGVRFLVEADRDNSLVDVYARANKRVSAAYADFRPDAQLDGFQSGMASWILLYRQRFPGSPLAEALDERAYRYGRIVRDNVGGWVSCFAHDLDTRVR